MIEIREITIQNINEFWDLHIQYLTETGMIYDQDELSFFSGRTYRSLLEEHMVRKEDKQHMAYFYRNNERIGAVSYCTYQSEDGKCFILDYWIFPEFRGNGVGHQCFEALTKHTKSDGALYYELNSIKEDSIRFWKSLGFVENGKDKYGILLLIKKNC